MATRLEDLLPLVVQIQADPSADARLDALAREVGLSPTHLQRVFAREIGESPKRIATRIALERAAATLLTSSDSVLEIALASGFDSHEGFTRAFRRQFDTTPSRYRERGLAGTAPHTSELATTHRETTRHVAPCVGLYRARSHAPSPKAEPMSYTIETKTLPATPILFMRRRVTHDGIAAALGELLPAVFSYATRKGIPLAGPPFCRYQDWSAAGVTLEAGLPTAVTAEGEDAIESGELPAGPAATTIHEGPYDGLGAAHAALEGWLETHAVQRRDGPWEVYLTDPGEVPDPAQWQTLVVCPTRE